jgi:para-aminobenzoate synthetase component 1
MPRPSTRAGTLVPPACWHLLEPVPLRLPFWQYYELFRGQEYSFLLDSAGGAAHLGRYSFLGSAPFLTYRAWYRPGTPPSQGARIQVHCHPPFEADKQLRPAVLEYQGDVFTDLQNLLNCCAPPAPMPRLLPFQAGAVGYFAYEAGRLIEHLPELAAPDLGLPALHWAFYDTLLAYDHWNAQAFLSVVGRGTTEDQARRQAQRQREQLLRQLRSLEACPPSAWPGVPPGVSAPAPPVRAFFDEAGYCQQVQQAREHILAGDVFEVCLTHRLESPFTGDPWLLYQELRRLNPAPFAAYLHWPEGHILCSSPERFLRLDAQGNAEARPIKGTRPRGSTPQEDQRLAQELAASPKDRAENLMIVDLLRNDLGRVCRLGSIHVPELLVVEPYATVFQLVSTIRGVLAEGRTPLELVRACFPGGSMTGAPKIEAMKIIDRLEPVQRGIYSGALGYLDFAGPFDLNIVIRTLLVRDGRAFYNVGGAVVADSDPRAEYHETLVKARALIQALANVAAASG